MLRERVKINLRSRHVDFFDYGYGDYKSQPLYWKSRLIDDSFPDFGKQKSFDKRLQELELPGMDGYGLSLEDFEAVLRHGYGVEVRGYWFYELAYSGSKAISIWVFAVSYGFLNICHWARNYVDHHDEGLRISVPSRSSSGGLKQTVQAF